jgi:hypothetical protein
MKNLQDALKNRASYAIGPYLNWPRYFLNAGGIIAQDQDIFAACYPGDVRENEYLVLIKAP